MPTIPPAIGRRPAYDIASNRSAEQHRDLDAIDDADHDHDGMKSQSLARLMRP